MKEELRKALVKKQMLKPIQLCNIMNSYCKWVTHNYCLIGFAFCEEVHEEALTFMKKGRKG